MPRDVVHRMHVVRNRLATVGVGPQADAEACPVDLHFPSFRPEGAGEAHQVKAVVVFAGTGPQQRRRLFGRTDFAQRPHLGLADADHW